MRVLDKTVCARLICTLWTGRRRLRGEDLGTLADELPPEELASMGSLKLCDPAELRELANIKRRAERACERRAVRFLGGYATDEKHIDNLVATLDELKAEFDNAASRIVTNLEKSVDAWVEGHPEWAEAIRRQPPDAKRIGAQLRFDHQVYRIGPAADDGAPTNDGLVRAASGLKGQLYSEIAAQARTTLKRSFEGKGSVGQRALRSIKPMAEKLDALSYLDGQIRPVLDNVRRVRDALPKTGEVAGQDLVQVIGLLNFLGDENQLAGFGAIPVGANGASVNGAGAQPLAAMDANGVVVVPQEEAGDTPIYF